MTHTAIWLNLYNSRLREWLYLVHNCTLFLCSLDVENIDDQCKGSSIKEII